MRRVSIWGVYAELGGFLRFWDVFEVERGEAVSVMDVLESEMEEDVDVDVDKELSEMDE